MDGALSLDAIPWPYLLAIGSIGLVYFLYRRRADAFEEIGFSGKEVALFCLGSTAGWAVNIPIVPLGNAYLAVNMGGALVPVFLAAWWIRRGKLNVVRALVGSLLVSVVAYRIVHFEPSVGIIALYPYFFLPPLAALAFAVALHPRQPLRSVPVAYVSGSIGALLGADVYNYPRIAAHYRAAGESAIISIGGAGVFDMVFLAGALAMSLNVLFVVALKRRAPEATVAFAEYPGKPYEYRDARRAWRTFLGLADPTPLERAVAVVALSNAALADGDYARAVRLARAGIGEVLDADRAAAALAEGRGPLGRDVRLLTIVAERAKDPGATDAAPTTRREAGDANDTAKLVLGALAPTISGRNRLEGL